MKKKPIEARWIAKKTFTYIINKFSFSFSLHSFLTIFFSQKWYFIERFINYTSFNLIPEYVSIKAPKEKTILTTPLGTKLKA